MCDIDAYIYCQKWTNSVCKAAVSSGSQTTHCKTLTRRVQQWHAVTEHTRLFLLHVCNTDRTHNNQQLRLLSMSYFVSAFIMSNKLSDARTHVFRNVKLCLWGSSSSVLTDHSAFFFTWNILNCSPNDTVSHHRRSEASETPLQEPQTQPFKWLSKSRSSCKMVF